MIPKSLSATSLLTYTECALRYKAEVIDRASEPSGSAAALGTAFHTAIENMVTWCQSTGEPMENLRNPEVFNWANMQAFWDEAYWAGFTDDKRYKEGVKVLKAWIDRQDWHGRTILSMEQKRTFMIRTSIGEIPVNYIMDRMDLLDNGDIEVFDYKSFIKPVRPEDLAGKIQVRLYALGAMIEYPDRENIMVIFDLLRYDLVGRRFSKAENRKTYRDIQALAEQIIANDEPKPTVCESCRYCIHQGECPAIKAHVNWGGTLMQTDGRKAALEHFELKNAIAAMEMHLEKLEAVVLRDLESTESTSYDDVPGYSVEVKIGSRRGADAERVAQIIGSEMVAKYGNIGVGAVDTILKTEDLTDDQKSRLRQAFTKTYNEPSLAVKPKPVI